MTTLNEELLDEKLTELEKLRAWSPRVISKLEAQLRTEDDWALFRANPFTFARERGVNEDEAVDLFLLAGRVGIFQMTWNLICPGCGAAVQSFASLKSLCSMFYCFLCGSDIETRLDDFVQVGFTISPRIRAIAAHAPERLSIDDFHRRYVHTREARIAPDGPRFVDMMPAMTKGQSFIEPGALQSFEIELEPGGMAVYDAISNALFVILVGPDADRPNQPLHLKLKDGRVGAPPIERNSGKFLLELENDGDQRAAVVLFHKPQAMIDEMLELAKAGKTSALCFDKFLSGRRLLTSTTFRQMFGTETIRSADGIGVRDISILFTDLKGSTAMYDRIGDLKAFALVNQHFERLARAVTRYRGAVVKTIGDAVMASFESPSDAVHAAHDMLREIETFNHEVGEREIVLKVGVHRGASIAVTLNERLDFFGQTVNIAARVQGLADADEIYITDDVYTAPGVKELLAELHVTPRQAQLKGVQRAVTVYRVGTTPESGLQNTSTQAS